MKKTSLTSIFFAITILFLGWLPSILPAQSYLDSDSAFRAFQNSGSGYFNQLQNRGRLIVAMVKKDQYPFFYITDSGSLVGLDVDIAKALAASLQLELQIDRSAESFNDLIPLVESGIVDIAISKLSRTLVRSRRVLFSEPYIIFRQGLLINRVQLARVSSSDVETKEIIRKLSAKLGVIANSSYERYALTNFPQAEIVPLENWNAALQALENSEVFAIYRDEMEIAKYIEKNPTRNLYFKSAVIEDRKDPIGIAVPPGAYHFLFYLNSFLSNIDFLPKDVPDLLLRFGNNSHE